MISAASDCRPRQNLFLMIWENEMAKNLNVSKTLILAAVLAVSGIVSSVGMVGSVSADTATLGTYKTKDFLSDYSKLTPVEGDKDAYRYIDPAVDFSKYQKLLLDRIKVYYKDDSDYKGIDPDDLKALTDYFHQAIVKAVGSDYTIVNEAGPDALRVRIAVTDLVPNKPEASVVSLAVPFAWVADAGSGAAKGEAGSTVFTGEATIEMEAMDSVSSEQVGAYIDKEVGKKYQWTKGVGEGVDSYLGAYSKWKYTQKAMDAWAQRLKTTLDDLKSKSKQGS
jgi:hypothetical protein